MSPKPTSLQVFAVRIWTAVFLGGFLLFPGVTILLLFTPLRNLVLLYLLWIFVVDKNICDRGGRTMECFRDFFLWKHFANYFPITSILSAPLELDPKKSYIFACFPHGLLCLGATIEFRSNYGNSKTFFPKHKRYSITLPSNFYIPFYREVILGIGSCSSSKESLEHLLGDPKGGKAIGLVPGGASEAQYSQPGGTYKLLLKNRKGFIKLALKYGSPIVPVFSFGEIDLYEQISLSEASIGSKVLHFLKKLTRIHFAIPRDGLVGLIPNHKPVTVVCK